jgi:hypothetical protein
MSIKIRNTEAYMENYAKKLMMLLRKRMNAPVQSRTARGFLNPVINNTGESAQRIQYNKQDLGNGLRIDIVGDDYLENINSGGVPPSGVNVTEIAEWIVSKPLGYKDINGNITTNYSKYSATHPRILDIANRITNKINTQGIEPTGFITRTVESHLRNLKVIAPVVEDVRENVVDILKAAGFNLEGKTVKFV